jgi:hypothetical protein
MLALRVLQRVGAKLQTERGKLLAAPRAGAPGGPSVPLSRGVEEAKGVAATTIAAVSVGHGEERRPSGTSATRGALSLSAVLLLVGFVVNGIQRMIWHPTGEEDDHEAIFTEYAASDAWEATHLAEFVLVLVALAGLLVFCRALRPDTPNLALLAAGAIIASGATWAALQAVDGVLLKQAVDAWAAAPGTEEGTRLADAESARWLEWGLQSYFRVLLGVAFLLLGAAAVVGRLVPSWLGTLLVVAGVLSLAIGISVGYAGLESGFQDAVGIALQLVLLVFIVGLLVVARRAREPGSRAASA